VKTCVWVWVTAVIAFLVASKAAGEEGGWKMPNLNPFAGKSGGTSGPPTSGWKMPNLLPKSSGMPKSSAAKRKSNQPGTLTKMTQGTQRFFSKTADVLNPFDDKPAEQPKITGSNSIFTQQRKSAEAKKDSSVSPASWFGGEKDDGKDKSVNDFLSRPRPY
jgi:hypothetical protein